MSAAAEVYFPDDVKALKIKKNESNGSRIRLYKNVRTI